MAGNYEIIKVEITPVYDASGSSYPVGYIKTTYVVTR
jgi:hypothetical protein